MNIQEAVKFVSELNKVTGEINRVTYESSPLLAGTMYNYQLTMACGAMKDGGLIEKAFGLVQYSLTKLTLHWLTLLVC